MSTGVVSFCGRSMEGRFSSCSASHVVWSKLQYYLRHVWRHDHQQAGWCIPDWRYVELWRLGHWLLCRQRPGIPYWEGDGLPQDHKHLHDCYFPPKPPLEVLRCDYLAVFVAVRLFLIHGNTGWVLEKRVPVIVAEIWWLTNCFECHHSCANTSTFHNHRIIGPAFGIWQVQCI